MTPLVGNWARQEKHMSGTHSILEVEHIHENYKIVVTCAGAVTFSPLPDKEVPVISSMKMPSQKFWDSISAMLKNMNERLDKAQDVQKAAEQRIADLKRIEEMTLNRIKEMECEMASLKEEKRKYIPVGGSRKNMFMAGITVGRQQAKNVRNDAL